MEEKIIKLMNYLNSKFSLHLNLSELEIYLIIIALIAAFSKQINLLIKYIFKRIITHKASKSLEPYYYRTDVIKSLKSFIRTKFQNVNPAHYSNSATNDDNTAQNDLLSKFHSIFKSNKNSNTKFFIILADAGLGKTTFMINLFSKFQTSLRYFFIRRKYDMILLPLGEETILEVIEQEKKKLKKNISKTILLLDALDEFDKKNKHSNFSLQNFLELTKSFKYVIITCRTHYFKTSEEEPNRQTGVSKFTPDAAELEIAKYYISPFTELDIKKYLSKTISIFNLKKQKRATQLLSLYQDLKYKPLLIGFLGELLNSKEAFTNNTQMFTYLVEMWIDREARKFHGSTNEKNEYKSKLYLFTNKLALHFANSNILEIELDKITDLAQKNNINLTEIEISSRSLITRNIENKYKFSHKSIFEYFVAKLIIDGAVINNLDYEKYDLVKVFYKEMAFEIIIKPILLELDIKIGEQCDISKARKIGVQFFDPVGSPNKAHLWSFNYWLFVNSDYLKKRAFNNNSELINLFYSNEEKRRLNIA